LADDGLLFAYLLNRQGGGHEIDLEAIKSGAYGEGLLWMDLDYTNATANTWLRDQSGIDLAIVEALSAKETRPRSLVHKDGMLVILRGINLNPDSDPEDMVSVRVWLEANRIISLHKRRVLAIEGLLNKVLSGYGPKTTGDFLEDLLDYLVIRMSSVISDLEDEVDETEVEMLSTQSHELRQKISNIRRAAISLRRYLAPQRDMMARLYTEKAEWLDEMERMRLREFSDRTTRYVEDLDSIRERATVAQEELHSMLTDQMNKTMYVLSIVAGIFLPLTFLTGMLGVNVGGIPGADSQYAFTIFGGILIVLAVTQFWFFKRMKWI